MTMVNERDATVADDFLEDLTENYIAAMILQLKRGEQIEDAMWSTLKGAMASIWYGCFEVAPEYFKALHSLHRSSLAGDGRADRIDGMMAAIRHVVKENPIQGISLGMDHQREEPDDTHD